MTREVDLSALRAPIAHSGANLPHKIVLLAPLVMKPRSPKHL
jgi:hypothetical protein